jgi:hypothetical protein
MDETRIPKDKDEETRQVSGVTMQQTMDRLNAEEARLKIMGIRPYDKSVSGSGEKWTGTLYFVNHTGLRI